MASSPDVPPGEARGPAAAPPRDPVTPATFGSRSEFPAAGRRLVAFAWFTLGFTLVTIIGGGLVRATHSGDGCGRSWPACEGQFVLREVSHTAQLIEFSHRAVSGIALLLVAALLVAVLRSLRPPHPARKAALVSMVLIIIEALIGAMIVLYGWVADDTSVARQVSVPLHLVNTFALTAALTLTVWLVSGRPPPRIRLDQRVTRMIAALTLLIVIVAATGATTSLADTVFTVDSIEAGEAADFSEETALIVRVRVIHPIVAIATGVLLALFVLRRADEAERRGHPWPGRIIVSVVAIQVGLGFLHIALMTPLVTALIHLALAQVLWISFILFALVLLSPAPQPAPAPARTTMPATT